MIVTHLYDGGQAQEITNTADVTLPHDEQSYTSKHLGVTQLRKSACLDTVETPRLPLWFLVALCGSPYKSNANGTADQVRSQAQPTNSHSPWRYTHAHMQSARRGQLQLRSCVKKRHEGLESWQLDNDIYYTATKAIQAGTCPQSGETNAILYDICSIQMCACFCSVN